MTKLSGKDQFYWPDEADRAFEELKLKLCDAPVLAFPRTGPKGVEFILDTDASNSAIGAVLSQRINDQEHVIAYGSHVLSKSERRYSTTRKELLAVIYFLKQFRPYLLGRNFIVRTDHASLAWLQTMKDAEGQIGRWLLSLQEYSFTLEHRPGRRHANADALSRFPVHEGTPAQLVTVMIQCRPTYLYLWSKRHLPNSKKRRTLIEILTYLK